MRTEHRAGVGGLFACVHAVLLACGGAGATGAGASEPATTSAATGFTVEMMAPDLARPRFVRASLSGRAPLEVGGCVLPEPGPCEESMRVVLDDDAREELEVLLDALAETPRCEPAATEPGDHEFALTFDDGTTFRGPMPADPARVAARAGGPCRADARLAFWLARWLLGEARPSEEQPSIVRVTLDATRDTGPRFVLASLDVAAAVIEGCTADARGPCPSTQRVALAAPDAARARALLEDVRSEPCHAPFPAGAPLEIEAGLVYDGPCGADADLAWWVGTRLDPDAIGAP